MSEFLENEKAQEAEKAVEKATSKNWIKRIGVAGFLFFLIKGLIWLVVLFGMGKGCQSFF